VSSLERRRRRAKLERGVVLDDDDDDDEPTQRRRRDSDDDEQEFEFDVPKKPAAAARRKKDDSDEQDKKTPKKPPARRRQQRRADDDGEFLELVIKDAAPEARTEQQRRREKRLSEHLVQFTRLKDIHPELCPEGVTGLRTFPRKGVFMPSFSLENAAGETVKNEAHEAYEQFVCAWMFSEVLPRYCLRHLEDKTHPENFEWRRTRRLRVLELGGGIGAVSTMIQQCLEVLDPHHGTHVVFEPNAALAKGALRRNKTAHGSDFQILNGVLSKRKQVPMFAGNIHSTHPRAWMWHTLRAEGEASVAARGYDLDHVSSLLGGPPNVLVADCEGGFPPVLADFPELLDHLVVLYYERDPGDYDAAETLLAAKGFQPVLKANLHRVYVNEAKILGSSSEEEDDDDDGPPDAVDELVLFPFGGGGDDAAAAEKDPSSQEEEDQEESPTKLKALAELPILARLHADVETFATNIAKRDGEVGAALRSAVEVARRKLEAKRRQIANWRDERPPSSSSSSKQKKKHRRLARHSRVAYQFDQANGRPGKWFAGLVTVAPGDAVGALQVPRNRYAVYFDDDDQVTDAERDRLRAIYVKGSFNWASPWIDSRRDDDHHRPPSHDAGRRVADAPPPPPAADEPPTLPLESFVFDDSSSSSPSSDDDDDDDDYDD